MVTKTSFVPGIGKVRRFFVDQKKSRSEYLTTTEFKRFKDLMNVKWSKHRAKLPIHVTDGWMNGTNSVPKSVRRYELDKES